LPHLASPKEGIESNQVYSNLFKAVRQAQKRELKELVQPVKNAAFNHQAQKRELKVDQTPHIYHRKHICTSPKEGIERKRLIDIYEKLVKSSPKEGIERKHQLPHFYHLKLPSPKEGIERFPDF